MKIRPQNQGFTLIELMVVVLIIVILGAIGLVSFSQANSSARDAKRVADIESVRQALLLYRQENSGYPPRTGTEARVTYYQNMNADLAGYIETVRDPVNTPPYEYTYRSLTVNSVAHAGFCLCARLQGTSKANSGSNCDFGASSPQYYCKTNP